MPFLQAAFFRVGCDGTSLRTGNFDAVVISNALHIMPSPEKALAEIRRVLKPDGVLIAPIFTAAGSVFGRVKVRFMELSGFRVFHKWKPQEYLDFLKENGFTITGSKVYGGILALTCGLQSKLLVMAGNDITPSEIKRHITENAPGIRKILFGFQATAGKKEENRYICERLGGGMDIGRLHGRTDLKLQKWVQRMFDGTDYRLKWQDDMESYLNCHLAAILPIAYLTYICNGDLRRSTGEQRKMMLNTLKKASAAG